MKIGVITFWQSEDNYGQQLQCWALQRFLKNEGHDVFLIRYDFANRIVGNGLKNAVKRCLVYRFTKTILKRCCSFRTGYKSRGFNKCRKENLTMSKRTYRSLLCLKKEPPFCDVYIAGSDQIWSQLLTIEENEVFYLNFGNKKTKRISYAPSFARNEYPETILPSLKKMLQNFDAVSVRDESSQRICQTVDIAAVKVLDPTLLLAKDEYFSLGKETSFHQRNNDVFIYSLNIDNPKAMRFDELKQLCVEYDMDCIATASGGYIPAKEFLPVKYVYPTIGEWISYIKNASFVVTPSFHGVVFCLIMHTPFVYIPLKGRFSGGNDRVFDLLRNLSLDSRILLDDISYKEIFLNPIDWQAVDVGIRRMQESSINFLLSSIYD